MVAKDVQKFEFFGVVLQQMIEKWRVVERERVQVKARQAFACRAQRSNTFSFPEALSAGKTLRRRRARGNTVYPCC